MALETVTADQVRPGDVLPTRWGDRQEVREVTTDRDTVARVTDVPSYRAVYLVSLTYGEPVGWRALPNGWRGEREA